jgi:hypothetical protein
MFPQFSEQINNFVKLNLTELKSYYDHGMRDANFAVKEALSEYIDVLQAHAQEEALKQEAAAKQAVIDKQLLRETRIQKTVSMNVLVLGSLIFIKCFLSLCL